jgi:hypothetical protein
MKEKHEVVCIETHSVITPDGKYSVERGRHLREDHPAVIANHRLFVRSLDAERIIEERSS